MLFPLIAEASAPIAPKNNAEAKVPKIYKLNENSQELYFKTEQNIVISMKTQAIANVIRTIYGLNRLAGFDAIISSISFDSSGVKIGTINITPITVTKFSRQKATSVLPRYETP